MDEVRQASAQTWEKPPAGVVDAVRAAAVRNQLLTDVDAPWARASLAAAELAHTQARAFVTRRQRQASIPVRRQFLRRDTLDSPVPAAYRAGAPAVVTYVALLWLASGTGLPADHPRVVNDPNFRDRPADAKEVPLESPVHGPRLCAHDPHTVRFDANQLGTVLGYRRSPGNRRERVRTRLESLERDDVRLIRRDRTPGPGIHVQVLHENGEGHPYTRPIAKEQGATLDPADYYFQVPVTLFTQGWAAVLSPRAILSFLLIVLQSKQRATSRRLGPRLRAVNFPMSDDQFYAGRGELAWWGLVTLTAGGERQGDNYYPLTYHSPVEGATTLRPIEIYDQIIVPAGRDPDGRLP